MKINKHDQFFSDGFERFDYRVVYMRPSPHVDERIGVGIVASSADGIETRFVSSVEALDLMTQIFGETGVEQYHFAADELRRLARCEGALEAMEVPTDLLVLGERMSVVTCDRDGILRGILANSSCLIRAEPSRVREVMASPTPRLCKKLYEHVSLLDPMAADDLFQRKIIVDTGEATETVTLPIYGKRIFGAPVSFASAIADQKVRAEAYIAKFHWLRRYLEQQPNVYLLSPPQHGSHKAGRSGVHLRELEAVAEASSVRLRISDTMEELASFILTDEAA